MVECPAKAGRSRVCMFWTYVLKNLTTGRNYIGSTNNLERRIKEHNRGQTKSTRREGIWVLVYSEQHTSQIEAKNREKVIKSYKGGNAFKELLDVRE